MYLCSIHHKMNYFLSSFHWIRCTISYWLSKFHFVCLSCVSTVIADYKTQNNLGKKMCQLHNGKRFYWTTCFRFMKQLSCKQLKISDALKKPKVPTDNYSFSIISFEYLKVWSPTANIKAMIKLHQYFSTSIKA